MMRKTVAIALTLIFAALAVPSQAQTDDSESYSAQFAQLHKTYAKNPRDVENLVLMAQFYFDNANPMRNLPLAMNYINQAESVYIEVVKSNKYSESARLVGKGITIVSVRELRANIIDAAKRTVSFRDEMSDAEIASYSATFASVPEIMRSIKQLQLKQTNLRAIEAGTVESYYNIIETYPATTEAENAEKNISGMANSLFENVNTISAADSIADLYPNSPSIRRAAIRRKSGIAYAEASRVGTVEAYIDFLEQYPSSDEFVEASEQYDNLLAAEFASLNRATQLADFAEKHSDNPLADSAVNKIVSLIVDDNDVAATKLYIEKFPNDSRYNEIFMRYYIRHSEEGNAGPIEAFAEQYPDFPFPTVLDPDLDRAREADKYNFNVRFDESMLSLYGTYVRRLMGKKIAFVPMQRMIQQLVAQRNWFAAGERLWQFDICFETTSADEYKELVSIIQAPANKHRTPVLECSQKFSMLHPAINELDKKIYYGRTKDGHTTIEAMARQGKKWGTPQPVEFDNIENHDLTQFGFFDGGRSMLLGHGGDIWVASLEKGQWRVTDILPYPVNTDYIETDAFMLPDGTGLLLASDRPNGHNFQVSGSNFHGDTAAATDLYFIPHSQDGWGEPVNLGAIVNTAYCERSPLLSRNLKTLYYITDSRGIGYGDIYMTTRDNADDWRHWSEPVNVGKEINTGFDEASITFANGERRIVYSSNAQASGLFAAYAFNTWHNADDSYREISLEVNGARDYLLNITVCDVENQSIVRTLDYWGETPTIDLYLHKNKNYLVMAAADRYFVPAVAVNPDTTLQPHLHGFTFQTLVAMEEPVELATVQFVENSDTLLPLALVQLDALAQFLLANPNGGVEFLVNVKGQDDAMCYTLSQQRAAALRRHLQNRGIAPERVHLSPYGNANTKIKRATPEVSIRFRER